MASFRVQQWTTFARCWWLYDAKWQCAFQSAQLIKKYLLGLHKPIYHPMSYVGDHVVVINAKDIALEGEKWRTMKFYHHTGYAGGAFITRAYELHDKEPTEVLRRFVYSSMKPNLQRRHVMEKLHIYHDDKVPEEIMSNISGQLRQVMPVPKKITDYSAQEIAAFPKLFDWPEDYVVSTPAAAAPVVASKDKESKSSSSKAAGKA